MTSLALVSERTDATGTSLQHPRIGLFSVPTSMDAGWTRWVLERYGFRFLLVSGADIEAGALRNQVDVLIVTDEPRGILAASGSQPADTRRPHPACSTNSCAQAGRSCV